MKRCPQAKDCVDIEAPVRENVRVAAALGWRPRDLTVVILDRPQHQLIQDVRQTGARIKLISDGDVAAAIATRLEDSGLDMLLGIGGAPEAVLAMAAIKRLIEMLSGQPLSRLVFCPPEEGFQVWR